METKITGRQAMNRTMDDDPIKKRIMSRFASLYDFLDAQPHLDGEMEAAKKCLVNGCIQALTARHRYVEVEQYVPYELDDSEHQELAGVIS